jgi:hypothetical protein
MQNQEVWLQRENLTLQHIQMKEADRPTAALIV